MWLYQKATTRDKSKLFPGPKGETSLPSVERLSWDVELGIPREKERETTE